MKKFALIGLLALLSFPVLRAQDAMPLEKSLLWEISGKDLAKPSYLYGTIHMIGSEDFFLSEETRTAFTQADKAVFEIDMEEMSNAFVQFSLLMDLFMEDGQTLRDLLDEADYKLVKEHFDDMGMPLMLLERIKPLFLSVFASGDIDQAGFSSGEIVSYEMEFMEMAQKDKKEIGGLETIEFQMSLFDSIPYKAQADMLVESIRAESTENSDQSFKALVELYKSQDLDAMAGSLEENDAMAGSYETILLSGRNANWIPVMQEMMQKKSCFFAVGAAHLGGSGGVIPLLRKEGYTLRPLHIQP